VANDGAEPELILYDRRVPLKDVLSISARP
jgi:hypothetical protein